MDIVGALAKSNTSELIYFCRFGKTEYEIEAINSLILRTGFSDKIYVSSIKALAIVSADNMKEDKRMVGMIIDGGEGKHTTIILDEYEDLDIYLREIAE